MMVTEQLSRLRMTSRSSPTASADRGVDRDEVAEHDRVDVRDRSEAPTASRKVVNGRPRSDQVPCIASRNHSTRSAISTPAGDGISAIRGSIAIGRSHSSASGAAVSRQRRSGL